MARRKKKTTKKVPKITYPKIKEPKIKEQKIKVGKALKAPKPEFKTETKEDQPLSQYKMKLLKLKRLDERSQTG